MARVLRGSARAVRVDGWRTMSHDVDSQLAREARAVAALTTMLAELNGEPPDEDTITIAAEGETGLVEAIQAALDAGRVDEALLDGLSRRIEEMQARARRIRARVEGRRAAIELALRTAGLRTLEVSTETLSLARRPRTIEVLEEADIPPEYWRAGAPTLDRRALRTALEAGPVAGARLGEETYTLTVRRS